MRDFCNAGGHCSADCVVNTSFWVVFLDHNDLPSNFINILFKSLGVYRFQREYINDSDVNAYMNGVLPYSANLV